MLGRHEGKKLRAWPKESKAGCGFKHIKVLNHEFRKAPTNDWNEGKGTMVNHVNHMRVSRPMVPLVVLVDSL